MNTAARSINRPRPVPPHKRVLSDAQIATYRDRGYVELRQVFDFRLLARLIAVTEQLWREGAKLTAKTKHFDLAAEHSPERPRIRRISSPTELDDVYLETAFDSVLGDIAADLIGGPVKFYHSKINFKLPGGGAEIGWHQDWPVFPHTNSNLVALSVPLNQARAGNGCLRSIPGSHRNGPRSHWANGQYVLNCNSSITDAELAIAEDSEVDPGDIVAHHGLTVHGSGPNHSEAMRTTYIIQYAAADAFAYTAPVIDSTHRNCAVRGEPASHARVEAGMIELPPDFTTGYSGIYSLQEKRG